MDSSKKRSAPSVNNDSKGLLNMFKMFDIYSKVDEDFRVQTVGGGWISIIGWVLILVLASIELKSFFSVEYKEHMIVDTTLRQKLSINVDITFHALTCADVHLDAMDVAGDNQLNMEQEMFKQRLSPNGTVLFSICIQ
jgi:endoplasmic reticulum-Golgi intermediate compartment protein 3